MFQPSHFQKMAQHLAIDSLSYEKEYNAFMSKLKNFHESKGTPFRRLPWLGGQYLDLYLLYRKVTSSGGWVKVTEDKKWRDIAEVFNLPPTCTNAAFALRQHYARYLESFERINFFGEDAEDVLAAGRPHTPVTASIMPTHIAQDYISVISTSKDATRNFDKLVLSLQCGMPNEVDFAINICMLLSNVSNSVFNLSKAPAVVDTLLAHVGVFSEDSHGLRELYDEWYIKQDVERDFIKFWKESLTVRSIRESLCGSKGDETSNEDSLFHPMRKRVGAKDVECQRVAQVCMILYNFSFDNTNANVLASHPLCLRFLVLCICGNHGFLQRMAWETLSNLAEKMVMEPIESTSTQMFFQMLHLFLDHKDRYHVTNAMDVLGKLCTLEGNDDVIEAGLEPEAYESLIKVLIVSDVQLVISSLESLYNLSGVGQVTSDHIAEVHRSIDVLVCLVTMDAESFGSEALSEVQIIENRAAATVPVTPKPQPTPIPVVPHQPKEPVQPHHVTHSSPSPSPAPNQAPPAPPTPTPVKTTGTEIDPETFTFNWLQGTYESAPGSSVSRIDIYADYLSSCSRLARVGILNATAFNRIIKLAFPDGQLRRAQSGTQVQYVLAGLRRKANPLPVKSRTDAPVHQQPGSVTPAQHPGQRVLPNPVQQGISRTPTSSTPPAWTVPKQQTTAGQQQSLAAPGQRFVQRSMQAPGVGQVVGTVQQAPGMIPLPRRPSVSSQGGNHVATDQGMRQFTEASIQQVRPNAPLSGHRQATGVPMQRAVAPLVQGQLPPSLRRTSTEGTGMSQGQNPQAFQQHHNQGPLMPQLERMPLPVQSQGLQRQVPPQQAANPMRVHQMPASPSQRIGPASFPQQLTTKSPQPLNLQGNVRIPQNPLARSPLPPHGPMQPPSPRPVSTPPPTGMVQRASSPAMPSSYQPTPVYQQPPPTFPQQPIRQPSPGLNGRPSYGSYPPLAPKPAPGMSIQGFPQRTQVPANPGAPGGYPGFPQVPRSPHQQPGIVRQNFQSPRPPPNMPQSPVLAPASVGGRQPFAGPHKDLAGGFAGRNSRQVQGLDVRPTNGEPLPGCRQDGVVLIAQEERAADVVSTGLLEGAEEQKIVVVENRNRTEQESNAEVTKNSISNQDTQVQSRPPANNMVCGRVNDPRSKICEPLNMCTGDQHTLPNSPRTISTPASNGGLKRNFDIHTSEASKMPVLSEDGLNGQRDREGDNCGPLKRPRLDDRMPSFENDLENSSTLPCRTGSPTALVNGDIKGDPRNKLMDKLLDKDLHIPLNGVCGIDTSELDLMASDGERLSSSKASSPDLFGSETNSDFGKYLEESDTDTGLFSDVLQGDLRIDPMENGTEGQQHTQGHHKSVESKSLNMPSFRGGPFGESGNILNEKGATAVIAAQGKIPISPSIAPETQTLHDGALPGRNVAVVNRYPATTQPLGGVTFNSAWNAGNTVALGSKPGFPQSFGTEVHQKIAPYPPQGKLLPNVDNRTAVQNTVLQNQRRDHAPTSTLGMQQNAFPLQNIPPNSQQMVVTHGTSRLLPSGVPQNILPRTPQTSVASSMVSGTQGMNVTRPSSAGPPPFQGGQQMHVGQTSASRVQPVGVPQNMSLVRGVQASDGSPSLVQQPQQQQPNLMPYPGPRMQGTTQNIVPGGLQVQAGMQRNSPGVSPGVQPHSMPPQQQLPNVYPDTRTRSMVTPGSSMFETTSVSQNRQPSATMPVQRQQPPPPLPPARKGIVQSPVGSIPGSMPGSEDIPFPPPLGNPTDTVVPQVDSFRPYKCRWATCFSSFDTSKGLFVHVVSEHVPRDSLVMSCMWEGCAPVRRSRSSLLFHMQQKHSEPTPGPSAPPPQTPAQHQPSPTQPPPQPQAPSSSQQTSFVPAYHFLARMLQSLQGEEESPLTKTVRLSAALVLRNIAQYSALARSMLRRHERHLSLVAMSNSEAANAVAACLSELSPHRKASCEDSDSFIWALNR